MYAHRPGHTPDESTAKEMLLSKVLLENNFEKIKLFCHYVLISY